MADKRPSPGARATKAPSGAAAERPALIGTYQGNVYRGDKRRSLEHRPKRWFPLRRDATTREDVRRRGKTSTGKGSHPDEVELRFARVSDTASVCGSM